MLYQISGLSPKIAASAFIAPNACIIGDVVVAEDASVWFSCVVRGDINKITIGEGTNIQDSCVLHVTNSHALSLGKRITVGHGAILHGAAIEDDCLIGMGAIVLDGALIGAHSIVAAGSIVSPGSQIPPGSLVMGVPGKVVRQVTERDRELIERGWQNYVGYSRDYRKALTPL